MDKPIGRREAVIRYFAKMKDVGLEEAQKEFDDWMEQKDEYNKSQPGIVFW